MVYSGMSVFTVSTGTDEPTRLLLNRHIRNEIAARWEDLGVELLNEKLHMLNNIAKNKPDVQSRCSALFEHWLSIDTGATWNKLIEALNKIDEHSLAEKIKRDVLNGIVLTP